MKTYSWKVRASASFSQFVNATFLGGHMNQTISARAFVEQHNSRVWSAVRWAADAIFGEDHCLSSHIEDYEFARDILDSQIPLK